jgi:GT2 family glycosyltransferase
MSDVRVSIVIPAHGHSGMVAHCVNSVIESLGADDDVEIVVVDDASEPPVNLGKALDPRVRLERSHTNLRFAGTCNYGASLACGDRLVFLNSDTEVRANWLDAMILCLESDPEIGIVGARLTYRDGTIQHSGVCFSQSDGMPRHLYRGFPGTHPAARRNRRVQAVTGACLLIDRNLFDAIGGFDSGYANGFEDIDLCLRAAALGRTIVSCGAADITHLESVSLPPKTPRAVVDTANAERFLSAWRETIIRDELDHYLSDGLIRLASGDVYPLSLEIDAALATVHGCDAPDLARLLNIRSRQIFDLEKEVGALSAKLLDHGIDP